MWFARQPRLPSPNAAPKGRPDSILGPTTHHVNGRPLLPPYPDGTQLALFGLGCFWGAEKDFWQTPGVYVTAAGYAGGYTPNPTYGEVCNATTGHAEVVRVVYDPQQVSYDELLRVFWEHHDPTQGMRQGNDMGTQYRSVIFTYGDEQQRTAEASRDAYQQALSGNGYGEITTEIRPAPEFYFAEDYHQQYLSKNPRGYCPDNGTGVACPIGLGVPAGEPAVQIEQV